MPKQIIATSSAPTPGYTPGGASSPIAQAVRFGDMLFVSGMGSVDETTGDVVEGDIGSQTRLALTNLERVLESAGASRKNIVNIRVTLRDVGDYAAFDAAFSAAIGGEKVTRTCIGGVPNRAGVNVQIDCIAMFD